MKINFQLYHWPVIVVVWFLISFAVSYIVAVAEHNINPLLPYISELGAWKPSSNVFGQLLNIGAVLSAITLYIRYHQIDSALKSSQCNLSKKWNELAFWLGFIIPLGVSIVANFQGDLKGNLGIFGMHVIGAVMAFGIGGIYLAIQIMITFGLRPYYKKYPQFGVSIFIQYVRLISTMVYLGNLLSVVVFALGTPRESNGYRLQGLLPGEDGYSLRAMSVLSEWSLAFIAVINVLSLTKEFKAITFEGIYFKRASITI